jgi:hypothetical protein
MPLLKRWSLFATAAFAFLWIGARAAIQSITIDEADTYFNYVAPARASHWEPAANNHVLNSMLMRLSTTVFGVPSFSMRLPALAGAAIYILSVYVLVCLITTSALLRWAVFVTMVFNPFVMDYLVAARGYSLALGFLMAAIAVAARRQASGADPFRTCALCSVLIALSFTANFSFAAADAAALAAIAVWCARRPYWRIALAAIVPGLAIAGYLTGAIVAHWPRNQFVWGATTFKWSLETISEQSFYKLSPYLVPAPFYEFLIRYRHFLLPLLAAMVVWRIWQVRRLPALVWIAGVVPIAAYAIHALLVWSLHLLWPRGRTALYVPPLLFLSVGALAGMPVIKNRAAASRRALTAVLIAIGCYFILSLRLMWFYEWYWNANSDRVYDVVAYYNHALGVRRIGMNWRYVSVLEFYRQRSGHETLEPMALERPLPEDRALYVLFPKDDEEFRRTHGLEVVYHDPVSDAEVAIRR